MKFCQFKTTQILAYFVQLIHMNQKPDAEMFFNKTRHKHRFLVF